MQEQTISDDERVSRGKDFGEQDCTDKENPYVSRPPCSLVEGFRLMHKSFCTHFDWVRLVNSGNLAFCSSLEAGWDPNRNVADSMSLK